MEVGAVIVPEYIPEYIPEDADTVDPARAVERIVEYVRLLRDGGFTSAWCSQHFVYAPSAYFQAIPLLSRLVPESGTMRLGTNVLLLPLLNPVEVAEQLATLDALSGGRLILGAGLGYRPEEFRALQVDIRTRVARLVEAVRIIDALWRGERLSFEGTQFRLDEVQIAPRPVQRPRPPILLGGVVDAAVRRAALLADGWIAMSVLAEAEVRRQIRLFDETRAQAGLPAERTMAKYVDVFLGSSRETALAAALPHLVGKHRSYIARGFLDQTAAAPETYVLARASVGTADDVVNDLCRQRDELGIDQLIVRLAWPSMEPGLARDNTERFAAEVLPALTAT